MSYLVAKIADDSDFLRLKNMAEQHNDWSLEYDKGGIKVWTKSVAEISFNMVKVWSAFSTVESIDLYNAIQDPDYRKEWDQHMIIGQDIGYLNPNNDVSYYAMSCPPPLRNRDFVLQRSWLDTGTEFYIINHSIYHKDYPPKKSFVRALSFFTGYFIKHHPPKKGCELSYVTSCDPQGILPSWLVNKCTQIFAPKYIKELEKAALGYNHWKVKNNPHYKPWIYPEQILTPKISLSDCVPSAIEAKSEQFLKREKSLSVCVDPSKYSLEVFFDSRPNMVDSRPSVSKQAPSVTSLKQEKDLQPSKDSLRTTQEGSSHTAADVTGEQETGEETIKRKSSRLFSWLDFTKTCRRKPEDS